MTDELLLRSERTRKILHTRRIRRSVNPSPQQACPSECVCDTFRCIVGSSHCSLVSLCSARLCGNLSGLVNIGSAGLSADIHDDHNMPMSRRSWAGQLLCWWQYFLPTDRHVVG